MKASENSTQTTLQQIELQSSISLDIATTNHFDVLEQINDNHWYSSQCCWNSEMAATIARLRRQERKPNVNQKSSLMQNTYSPRHRTETKSENQSSFTTSTNLINFIDISQFWLYQTSKVEEWGSWIVKWNRDSDSQSKLMNWAEPN